MQIASSYPLLEAFWTILIFFAFVVWLWILFIVLSDLLRRNDLTGATKVAWILLVVLLPYLGVFAYVIVENEGMGGRSRARQRAGAAQGPHYVTPVATGGDPAGQVAQARELLDQGAISRAEYDQIARNALAR